MTNHDAVDTTSQPTVSRSTRRALLGLGVVGAALATSRSVSAASGAEMDAMATAVIGAELAASDLYRAAPADMGADGLPAVLAANHAAFAQRISGIVGISANTRADALYDSMVSDFEAGDLDAAVGLENSLAATQAALLGKTDNPTLLSAIASIVSAESRQAAVLATEAGDDVDVIISNPAEPLAPEA